MLYKIQKELIHKKSFQHLTGAEQNSDKYRKLKKEYEKLSEFAKKQLIIDMRVFLLLTAMKHEDLQLASQLVDFYDYHTIDSVAARTGLARFYAAKRHKKKSIELFLRLFDEQNLNSQEDVASLFLNLLDAARHQDCDRVFKYALEKFPTNLNWKIQALDYQIKISHLYAKNKDFIKNNLDYLENRCEAQEQYFLMGSCFFSAGYVEKAITFFDKALQTVQLGFKPEKTILKFDSTECKLSMDGMIDILEKDDIKAFPIAGSLLGLVRDGKFMDYDKDADLGIFVTNYEDVFKIVNKLCEYPKFFAPDIIKSSKETNTWNIPIYNEENGMVVDLFFFYKQSKHFEYGVHTACGTLKWTFAPFELVRGILGDKEYWLPNNIELMLEEMYGDWRTPIEAWDSLLDCPNLTSDSRPVALFYGLIRLYKNINEGKTKKALNYYQKLKNPWGMKFSTQADDNIKKMLGLAG